MKENEPIFSVLTGKVDGWYYSGHQIVLSQGNTWDSWYDRFLGTYKAIKFFYGGTAKFSLFANASSPCHLENGDFLYCGNCNGQLTFVGPSSGASFFIESDSSSYWTLYDAGGYTEGFGNFSTESTPAYSGASTFFASISSIGTSAIDQWVLNNYAAVGNYSNYSSIESYCD